MRMPRRWLVGGAIYTLVIVMAVVVRMSAWGQVPDGVYSVAITVSEFGTLPPYFAGIGIYAGIVLAYTLQDLTGWSDSNLLLSSVAWLATALGAALVAVADVYLARWALGLIGAARPQGRRSSRVPG